jgi:hypothetical protein
MHSRLRKGVLALAGAAALAGGALGTQSVSAAATDSAEVILMYHDFYGPSSIWINKSTDGGATYGAPENVVANFTATNPTMDAVVAADMACNTVPSAVKIVKSGPHAGRIYLAWIAADAAQNTSGCNLSMAQSFHNLIVAWSDDNGATWTPQVAMDIGIGQDASTPFAAFTIDDQGNPYFAFDSQTPQPLSSGPSARATTCAAESATGTGPITDTNCDYHMWVIWSPNGGTTWDDGGGIPAGSASIAYEASPSNQNGTDQFATIAAGDPGKVDISYLHTSAIEPQDAFGKFDPLGCDGGDNATNTDPLPTYPPRCDWNLFVGQSLNLASTTSNPLLASWSNAQATSVPMHFGDICNLGIACAQQAPPVVPRDPRHLLDFNMETVDPTTGCAHIIYADDNSGSVYGDSSNLSPNGGHMVTANQTRGQNILGLPSGTCAGVGSPGYTLNQLPQYGGEPSITSDTTGELYGTSPNIGMQVDLSANKGVTWSLAPADPDPSSGDNCLGTDQSNALYACNLNGSVDTCALQADVWKTTDLGMTWLYGNNTTIPMPAGTSCGTSQSPFGVDRQWVDAWIPPPPSGVPEAPWPALFLPIAAIVGGMSWVMRRRRNSAAAA